MIRLNIGCGNLPKEGYKNIDISKEAKADEYYDASKEIKEEDESVEEIHCGCMMEQIDDLVLFLNECHRVLKDGGELNGYVPSTDPSVLHLDPMDKKFFQIDSFNYFNKNKHHWNDYGRIYGFRGWSHTEAYKNENGIIHFKLTK